MEENVTLATATNKARTKELILAHQREENEVAPRTEREVNYLKHEDSKKSAGANVYFRGKSGPQPSGLRGAPRGLRGTSMHLKTVDTAEQAMSLECVQPMAKSVTCVGNGTISPKSAKANK